MIEKIILDENDVRDAIAEKYGVKKDDVKIQISSRTVGYGMGERDEKCVKVEITK